MKKKYSDRLIPVAVLLASVAGQGCSSVRGIFAADSARTEGSKPIRNPFGDYQATASQDVTDFVMPVPAGQARHASSRSPASVEAPAPQSGDAEETPQMESRYREQTPTMSDREITRTFPQSVPQSREESGKQRDIESGLGLMASDDGTPDRQKSYLASVDFVKQLYRSGRYEAGLLEVDNMIHDYPTDPKLHEMRGTLLDRMGRREMAIKSWNQALRFDPSNKSLRHFVERREQNRGVASSPRGNP